MEQQSNRDKSGKFTKGNRAAQGNPYTKKAAELRKALYQSVTGADIRLIVEQLKAQAMAGDLKAISLLLDRLLGAPQMGIDLAERIEKLEQLLSEENADK